MKCNPVNSPGCSQDSAKDVDLRNVPGSWTVEVCLSLRAVRLVAVLETKINTSLSFLFRGRMGGK